MKWVDEVPYVNVGDHQCTLVLHNYVFGPFANTKMLWKSYYCVEKICMQWVPVQYTLVLGLFYEYKNSIKALHSTLYLMEKIALHDEKGFY